MSWCYAGHSQNTAWPCSIMVSIPSKQLVQTVASLIFRNFIAYPAMKNVGIKLSLQGLQCNCKALKLHKSRCKMKIRHSCRITSNDENKQGQLEKRFTQGPSQSCSVRLQAPVWGLLWCLSAGRHNFMTHNGAENAQICHTHLSCSSSSSQRADELAWCWLTSAR